MIAAKQATGSPLEVFRAFFKLGLTCFGGPIAHLGYFRNEFVVRRKWLDEESYANLVALAQFLPGPASSQVGFSLGLLRAGYLGGLLAFVAFTLPSAIALVAFAYGAGALAGPIGSGLMHGLRLVAVAIVAQAVWGMARALCPDRTRAAIAVGATLMALASTNAVTQISAIVFGGLAGLIFCQMDAPPPEGHIPVPVSPRAGIIALVLFFCLMTVLPLLRSMHISPAIELFDAFYRAGALVFGGGHVVLPLLRDAVVTPGWVSDRIFLAGYGAVQAVPGPLFTFSAYLGTLVKGPPNGILGATISLIAIFLPGLLVMTGVLPFWDSFRRRASAQAAMRGVNASVVGMLGAALYDPVWTTSVKGGGDFGLVLSCFILLVVWRLPPLVIVSVSALGGIALGLFKM